MDITLGRQRIPAPAAALAAGRLCPEYRDVVDRTVELLMATKSRLRSAVPGVAVADAGAATEAITKNLWNEWRAAWVDAAACLAEIAATPEHLRLAKDYTETHLTCELMGAPLWRQAYTKPLGYPGDYRVMDYMYQREPEGDTRFGQVAHDLAVHIGQFVVKRKELVRHAIAEAVAQHGGPGPCVVASLGSGPSREVTEFLAHDPLAARPTRFFLIDQDGDALCFAGRKLAEAVRDGPSNGAARIEMRHLSVLRLLREIEPVELLPPANLIYSAGLLDYFSDRTCRILTKRLYEALRPGGHLLLGNMKAGTDMLWPLELIADWSLRYRSAESILAWTEGLEGAEISLRTEATGYDYLLSVRKA